MLAVVFLYQDWIPFLLAIGYVAVDHGLVGSLFPGAVYNHPSALAHPFQWALIHAAFVLAESAALIAGWKIIESTENLRRSEMTRFNQELASQAESLARSEDIARKANAAKSEFLASMSHELRTPMSSILGFAEVLADGLDGELNPAQLEDIDRIRRSGDNLLVLLDDLLDRQSHVQEFGQRRDQVTHRPVHIELVHVARNGSRQQILLQRTGFCPLCRRRVDQRSLPLGESRL